MATKVSGAAKVIALGGPYDSESIKLTIGRTLTFKVGDYHGHYKVNNQSARWEPEQVTPQQDKSLDLYFLGN